MERNLMFLTLMKRTGGILLNSLAIIMIKYTRQQSIFLLMTVLSLQPELMDRNLIIMMKLLKWKEGIKINGMSGMAGQQEILQMYLIININYGKGKRLDSCRT